MRMIVGVVVTICLLAGCATTRKIAKEELAKADYGSEVTPAQFDKLAKANLEPKLIDPLSLLYYGTALEKLPKYWAVDSDDKLHVGYVACYEYNSKNRMGGYGGKSKECAFVEKGKIVQVYEVHPRLGWFPSENTMNGRF